MSKLYTQEQVKHMIDDAHNGIDGYYAIFKKHTPIELPSDEEIYIEAQVKKENIKLLPFDTASFQFGALWLRDKIKGEEDAR